MKGWQPTPVPGVIPVGGRLFVCRETMTPVWGMVGSW
jgi:hypothetical protein